MAKADENLAVIWEPQPRQAAFITCPADDVGFGGARGGGKSDAVIGDWISHEERYGEAAVGMAFRRERTQLLELIERAKLVMTPLGYKWHEQDKYFRGPKGGRLRFSYLERDSDADAYQGHSYTRLYPEEMGTFPSESPINKMQATLRSGAGVPCQMKGTCNPGGAGHQWVKARYRLDTHPQGMEVFEFEFENPFTKRKIVKRRVFIPSRVVDNRYLGDDYVANLFTVGSPSLVKAWLEGDWSVIEGAFFPEFTLSKHVITPAALPETWTRFRSLDWGSARPFCVGWYAVAGDDFALPDGGIITRGCLVKYREWYGSTGVPNEGLKLTAEQVGEGISAKEKSDPPMSYAVADPAAFSQDGGPSIIERMVRAGCKQWRPADNKRIAQKGALGGWDQLRARLVGDGMNPGLVFFSTCKDTIRTLPALQHDADRPEDVDTESEDHAPDETRYACMSRPYQKVIREAEKNPIINIGGKSTMTMNDLITTVRKRNVRDR
jgi:hypothetical protein